MSKRMDGLMSLLQAERVLSNNEWRYDGTGVLDWQSLISDIDNTVNTMWSKDEIMIGRENLNNLK